MYTEPTDPAPLVASASLSRTENYQGTCLGIGAEIHIGSSFLQPDACEDIKVMDDVLDVENGGGAVRVTLDRELTPEESLEAVRRCVTALGFVLKTPIIQWKTRVRTN